MGQQIPEGWYPDPQATAPGGERWWNGHHWTAHTRTVQPPPGPPPSLPAVGGGPAADARSGRPDLVQQFRALPKVLPDGSRVAEISERMGAYAVDVLLVWLVATVVSTVVQVGLGISGRLLLPGDVPWYWFGDGLDGALLGGFWLLYQLAFRGSGGATVGKRMLRLRVRPLPADGPLATGQVLRRAVLGGGGVLFLMFPGAQLFGVLLLGYDLYRMTQDPHGRPWHDQVAGTAVVKVAG